MIQAQEDNFLDSLVLKLARGLPELMITGVSGAQKAYIAALIRQKSDRAVALYLTATMPQAQTVAEDLSALLPELPVRLYPPPEVLPYEYYAESPELMVQRLGTLAALSQSEPMMVVAPLTALMRRLPPPESFQKRSLVLRPGPGYERESLVGQLVELGYERVERVETFRQFAVRGDIIDIYPVPAASPYRLELFDDEIDSIREFDPESQRSAGSLDEVWIWPATEIALSPDERNQAVARFAQAAEKYSDQLAARGRVSEAYKVQMRVQGILERTSQGLPEPEERLIPFAYSQVAVLVDYLPSDTLIFMDEPSELAGESTSFARELLAMQRRLLEEGKLLPAECDLYLSPDELFERLGAWTRIHLGLFGRKAAFVNPHETLALATRSLTSYNRDEQRLAADLKRWHEDSYHITLRAGTTMRAERLKKWLAEQLPYVRAEIRTGAISEGFELPGLKTVQITDSELFGRTGRPDKRRPADDAMSTFSDLKPGDLVVHISHGIGRYGGVNTLDSAGIVRDYLVIEYQGSDKLYVPTDQVYLLQKYVGSEDERPRLSKLGGSGWEKAKKRVKKSVADMAEELLALYARRSAAPGNAFSPDTVWQKEFEDEFCYEETPDQHTAIAEIKKDMEQPHPMDRLLCGDVGYGKTEVAIRAAFKAVMDQKQVAVLVPTTILAEQHYATFSERLADYPVNVEALSRFRSRDEQNSIVQRLRSGEIDIIIGTHRLLSKDVGFQDLGLVIVDEEQRFGVRQKERLKELRSSVDVLTLTATPIPRTLHMSMVGLRDMSVIRTPPQDRYPVQTYVIEYSDSLIRDAISRELARGGQVFYLYNWVEGIEGEAARIKALLPEARVGVAHGQMSETRLEKTIQAFLQGETDVLVCTSIIENGLDMPNVNTLIVRQAERLGLAQLYQLRGRVGRSSRIAYAYFTYQPEKVLTPIAQKRLRALREFTELGSGFKLALRDLEIRGAGSILGAEQHGHIAAVGFEMYCRLMEEALEELRGNPKAPTVEPLIDLPVNAYLPDEYVSSARDKIQLYKAIAACSTEADVGEVAADLIDRYGDPPAEVESLLEVAVIRALARAIGIESISHVGPQVVLSLAPGTYLLPEEITALMAASQRRLAVNPHKERQLVLRSDRLAAAEIVRLLKGILVQMQELITARSAGDELAADQALSAST